MSDEERGEDNVHDATLPVLIRIQETLVELRGDITGLRTEVREGLAHVNARLDSLIETGGAGHRAQEERITRLEKRVNKLERGTARARRPTRPRR